MPTDKRRHQRVRAAGAAAHIRTPNGKVTSCLLDNLSAGGAFVRTWKPLPMGTVVQVDVVPIGPMNPLHVEARVVTVVKPEESQETHHVPGMGIAFSRFDPKQMPRLHKLIHDLALKNPGDDTKPVASVRPVAPQTARDEEHLRLALHARGLQEQLYHANTTIEAQNTEIARMRDEVARLYGELQSKNRLIAKWREKPPPRVTRR